MRNHKNQKITGFKESQQNTIATKEIDNQEDEEVEYFQSPQAVQTHRTEEHKIIGTQDYYNMIEEIEDKERQIDKLKQQVEMEKTQVKVDPRHLYANFMKLPDMMAKVADNMDDPYE